MTACKGSLRADLHLHTTASDGALSPEEMVRQAQAQGIGLIAIADHDTVAGVAPAVQAGQACGVRVLPAIELSCGNTVEMHLLGYGVSPESPALAGFLATQLESRRQRMLEMLTRLATMGIEIAPSAIRDGDSRFCGRVDLAQALIARRHASSIRQAFDRYLKPGKPAYVPRRRVRVEEGIAALCAFGATVALAHPGRSAMDRATLEGLLPGWMEAGLKGLEVHHPSHNAGLRRELDHMARRRGLLVTGGSDSHGRSEGPEIGDHLPGWHSMGEDVQALLSRVDGLETGKQE